ncbi:hypothetical protein [Paraclostridium dentum]|uniref:hypothetical protein n=1 Tax=Paraclostridium dentum TaxID=2662455 RepID=UPI00147559D3|nr:hypothetical protein [Paraclostridium dentum]
MKKILVALIMLLSLSLVGCSKAEKVVNSEYVSRMERLTHDTIRNTEVYNEKYLDSEVVNEKYLGGKRDSYKDFADGLSAFRTEDEEINKLHDKIRDVSLDLYNRINEKIQLEREQTKLYSKSDLTDEEEKRLKEIEKRQNELEDMLKNQEEHIGNIGYEISKKIGVE